MEYIVLSVIFFALIFDKLNIFLFLIISALLHETGHIFSCWLLGIKPKIKISFFGIKLCRYPEEKIKKLIVLISGPFVNILLAIISNSFLYYNFSLKLYTFMCVNLVLFLFNIMPIYFLDGGQVITLLFDNYRISKITDIISVICIGVLTLHFSNNNVVSLLIVCMFLIYYCLNKKDLHY